MTIFLANKRLNTYKLLLSCQIQNNFELQRIEFENGIFICYANSNITKINNKQVNRYGNFCSSSNPSSSSPLIYHVMRRGKGGRKKWFEFSNHSNFKLRPVSFFVAFLNFCYQSEYYCNAARDRPDDHKAIEPLIGNQLKISFNGKIWLTRAFD